jgi:nucleotide-binding universal stress UspA family protein
VAPHIAARAEHDIAAKITDFRLQSEAAGVLTTVNVRRGDERHKEIVAEAQSLGSELIVLRQSPQRCLLSSLLASDTVVNEVVTYSPCHTLVVPREAHIWNNRILVAVEATNQDSRIFAAAINFALQWNLPLHLLIVFTDEKWRAGAQAFVKAMRNQATQAGVAMDGEIRLGEPVMEILTFLESSHSDLIIMGSYDENHKGRSKIGGAMRKVLALSRHPVLVVRLKDK